MKREKGGRLGIESARRKCLNRKNWRHFCCNHSLGEVLMRGHDLRNIDRQMEQNFYVLLKGIQNKFLIISSDLDYSNKYF